mmetsp:Transcript_5993/g.10275  ORF Transcript_5993/g.10275 Transcript_5993/m.10275 type:complete len:85 (+) Transcript_5993:41-295(+)
MVRLGLCLRQGRFPKLMPRDFDLASNSRMFAARPSTFWASASHLRNLKSSAYLVPHIAPRPRFSEAFDQRRRAAPVLRKKRGCI